jgi:hypothetical protein
MSSSRLDLAMGHMRDSGGHNHKKVAKATECLKTTPNRVKSYLADMAIYVRDHLDQDKMLCPRKTNSNLIILLASYTCTTE